MKPIRTTAAVTAILVYALIVLGAVVRTTNSGLSCPDWPTCYGHWVPLPSDLAAVPNIGYTYAQVMLEWVHRLIAGVFVGPLVLLLAVLTFLRRRERPDLAIAGAALVVLLLVQGALGGLTVLDRNSPWSVAIHLGTALLVLTVTLRIFTGAAGWSGGKAARPLLMPAAAAWCLALLAMMSAAMTAKSGASLACATWPSCNGALIPDLGDYYIRIHFTHRVLAAATGGDASLPFLAQPLRAAAGATSRDSGGGPCPVADRPGCARHPARGANLEGRPAPGRGVLTFAIVTLILWRCAPASRGAELGDPDGLALRGA